MHSFHHLASVTDYCPPHVLWAFNTLWKDSEGKENKEKDGRGRMHRIKETFKYRQVGLTNS